MFLFRALTLVDKTNLTHSIENKDIKTFKSILDKDDLTDLNVEDTTLLHKAIGNMEMTDYLLSRGVDPNLTDENGETPIFVAVRNRDTKMVRYLIGKGSTTYIANNKGVSLFGLCHIQSPHSYSGIEQMVCEKVIEEIKSTFPGRVRYNVIYYPLLFYGIVGINLFPETFYKWHPRWKKYNQ